MEFQGPFDKNARRALAASVHRAGMLGRETVGTEHLLLGLSASAGGTASKLLADAGAGGWRSRAADGKPVSDAAAAVHQPRTAFGFASGGQRGGRRTGG